METNTQQIQNELLPLSDKAVVLLQYLMGEKGYIKNSLAITQRYFSGQDVGRAIIRELTQAMQEVERAHCELEQIKGAVIEFVRVLTN